MAEAVETVKLLEGVKLAIRNAESQFLEPLLVDVKLRTLVPMAQKLLFVVKYIDGKSPEQVLLRLFVNTPVPNKYKFKLEIPAPNPDSVIIGSILSSAVLKVEAHYVDPALPEGVPEDLRASLHDQTVWSSLLYVRVRDAAGRYKAPTDEDLSAEDILASDDDAAEEEGEEESDSEDSFIFNDDAEGVELTEESSGVSTGAEDACEDGDEDTGESSEGPNEAPLANEAQEPKLKASTHNAVEVLETGSREIFASFVKEVTIFASNSEPVFLDRLPPKIE